MVCVAVWYRVISTATTRRNLFSQIAKQSNRRSSRLGVRERSSTDLVEPVKLSVVRTSVAAN
jgi:hypothetical protein